MEKKTILNQENSFVPDVYSALGPVVIGPFVREKSCWSSSSKPKMSGISSDSEDKSVIVKSGTCRGRNPNKCEGKN